MDFNKSVVEDFYYYRGDPNGELNRVAAIWRMIYHLKSIKPGYMLYLEVRVKKQVRGVQTKTGLITVLEGFFKSIVSEQWSWDEIACLFYVLHLIDEKGEFWIIDLAEFRQSAIDIVGDKLGSIIEEFDWTTIPIITILNEKYSKQDFCWLTFISGAVVSYFVYKLK